ncbi:MAG: hypothetical protein ACK4NZ_04870 [Tsuneonella sp.]
MKAGSLSGRAMSRSLLLSLRLWAAAMIAVIGLQAIPAQALPDQPTHGSAFSASTVDVALAAREVAVDEVAIDPAPVPHPAEAIANHASVQRALQSAWGTHRQTGPPLRPLPLRGGPTPRGPPLLT